ncbi:MAG TPA: M28 family peptidase [Candidatus Acidoferrales bacterium]
MAMIFLFARSLGAQHSSPAADAQKPPLLSAAEVGALDQELSGETAKRNLEGIVRFHRVRGSRGFHDAAELVAERARAYGLSDVQILEFPADGKIFYGTQRSRPPWDADFAELWEMQEKDGKWSPAVRLASWDAMPVTLAEDSESADVTADLVDVGDGTKESDYAGKDVRGKIVLAAAQPGAVQHLAVEIHGAAGIVSYALNQPQAWQGEDENLIRWGHLESFALVKAFAFMASLKTARGLRARLAHGETIRLHAVVKAGQHSGAYEIVTATIPGADPKLRDQEIAFSCHLDHQRPGANDNASGCVTILEVARTLQKLITEGKLARPARTLRFIWPPEIEGTTTLLNARPEFASRIKAVVHMDMVGGGPATKAIFHVTRGPMSLPSFVYDVGEAFGDFVNRESDLYASTGAALYPFVSAEGGKEALQAEFADYTMGSDHDVYQEGSFRIPAIYLNDWPDRYIHTNGDTSANIDPTKLKRAAFIGAASGYFLAGMGAKNVPEVLSIVERESLVRIGNLTRRVSQLSSTDHVVRPILRLSYERAAVASIERFAPLDDSTKNEIDSYLKMWSGYSYKPWLDTDVAGPFSADEVRDLQNKKNTEVFQRNASPKGPMTVFGYDYLMDHLAAKKLPRPKLLEYQGLWGAGEEYAYETLNFVDGKRDVQEITEDVSAEYGAVAPELVLEYLQALESVGVLKRVPAPPSK